MFFQRSWFLTFVAVFSLLSLLMLNGSHSMSVNHQHVRPLPLSLLAVFLGKRDFRFHFVLFCVLMMKDG